MRILIVEDEDLIRLMLAEVLIDEGFQVSEASTGAEAMHLIDGPDRFHAVVTDINMPGEWNGIAVGRHARRRHPSIPVIYCTGRPDALHAGLLGPRDILIPKPYVPSQVIGVLCQFLARPCGSLERPPAWPAAAALLMQPGSGGGLILPRLGQEGGTAWRTQAVAAEGGQHGRTRSALLNGLPGEVHRPAAGTAALEPGNAAETAKPEGKRPLLPAMPRL